MMLPEMNAAWSLAGSAVGHGDKVGAGLRQPPHILREFDVVADQHADLQAASSTMQACGGAAREQALFVVAVEVRLAIDPRLVAIDEDGAVVDCVAVALGKAREDRDAGLARAVAAAPPPAPRRAARPAQ